MASKEWFSRIILLLLQKALFRQNIPRHIQIFLHRLIGRLIIEQDKGMLLPGQQDEAAFHAAGGKPVMELNGFIGENDFVVEALHMGHGLIIRARLQKRGNRRARPVFFQPFPRLDGLHIAGTEKLPVQPPGQIHRAVKIDNIIGPASGSATMVGVPRHRARCPPADSPQTQIFSGRRPSLAAFCLR